MKIETTPEAKARAYESRVSRMAWAEAGIAGLLLGGVLALLYLFPMHEGLRFSIVIAVATVLLVQAIARGTGAVGAQVLLMMEVLSTRLERTAGEKG